MRPKGVPQTFRFWAANMLFAAMVHLLFSMGVCQTSGPLKTKFSIEENLPANTTVGRIIVTDGYNYSLSTNTDFFTVDRISGNILTKSVIDRELLDDDDIKFVVAATKSATEIYFNEVTVTIIDLNDNAPIFKANVLNFTVMEGIVPQNPFTLTATDPDEGVNGSAALVYSITSVDDSSYWSLVTKNDNETRGSASLSLLKPLDRETTTLVRVIVTARDGGSPPKTGTATVNINVVDDNDNYPKFDFSQYSAAVFENAMVGSAVVQAVARDIDSGFNAALAYSLTPNKLFEVDRLTGMVKVSSSLLNAVGSEPDMCKAQYCNTTLCLAVCVLEIRVLDQEGTGSNAKSDLSRLYIQIMDVNNNAPVIELIGGPHHKASEDATAGQIVFSFSVQDIDKGDNGKVSARIVSGNEQAKFSIICRKIVATYYCPVTINGSLDKKTSPVYNLTILATDGGLPSLSSTTSVIVEVTAANEHSPVFLSPSYSTSISELAPVNSFVAALTATDADEDENGRITYQFVSGNSRQFFQIDTDTGLVTVGNQLDCDSLDSPFLLLNVSGSDHGTNPLRSYANLSVVIIDENDESPTFSQSAYTVQVAEGNRPNIILINLTATDRDKGMNGTVRYRLSNQTDRHYPGVFAVSPTSGQLTLNTVLDRELLNWYDVQVIAYDLGFPRSLSSTVDVFINVTDVNDNAPIWYPKNYYSTLQDTAWVGSIVVTVTATDQDLGENASISYRLSGNTYGKFTVDANKGDILVSSSGFDIGQVFNLQVDAYDGGGRSAPSKATVEVRVANPMEPDPEFLQNQYAFDVAEDASGATPAIGTRVGAVLANASTVVEYYIISGDPYSVFNINSASGVLTTRTALDRELQAFYQLTVLARGLSKAATTSVQVTILDKNDNSPDFALDRYEIGVSEDSPIGEVIFIAQASDADTGLNAQLTYSLNSVTSSSFAVDRSTGAVTLTRRVSQGQLFTFTVAAADAGQPQRSGSATIEVTVLDANDHSPVFQSQEYAVGVNESVLVNTRFLSVSATDDDIGDNSCLSYSIISGVNFTQPEFGIFPDGVLYVACVLDRERKDHYTVVVQAQDGGSPPRKSTVSVDIWITDANDNSPVFNNQEYTFLLLEGRLAGSYIGSVSAGDNDTSRNADLNYVFASEQQNFELDQLTGEIRSMEELDREALVTQTGQDFFTLTIYAYDNGFTRRNASATVTVVIGDINDNAPKFAKPRFEIMIAEDVPPGSIVHDLPNASDADEGLNALITYSIAAGNDASVFSLDAASGTLTVASALDRETCASYSLIIVATDSGTPRLSSSTTLLIRVGDVNDNKPIFTQASYTANLREDSRIGSYVARVLATDADIGINAVVEYSFPQDADASFSIDSYSGVITLRQTLDFEQRQLYRLDVVASNVVGDQQQTTAPIFINVLDVNDNPPIFPSNPIIKFLTENVPLNTSVVQASATDADSGANGQIVYQIVSEYPKSNFYIDAATGQIYTNGSIDREAIGQYKIVVEASDMAQNVSLRLSTRKMVAIYITDLNDNKPEFMSSPVGVVPENSPAGIEVMTVWALDKDELENGNVTYSLLSGNNYFRIDQWKGVISLVRSISLSLVNVTVRASDQGQVQSSADQNLMILITSSASSGLQFTGTPYSKSIPENVSVGTNVLLLSTNVIALEFYVTKVVSFGKRQPALFRMFNNGGQLQVAMPLDRDSGFSEYSVEVYARDPASQVPATTKTDVKITLIDVNDSPPEFAQPEVSADVSEAASLNSLVTVITATDKDLNPNILYTLSDSSGKFSINTLGQVRVSGALKARDQYVMTVTASDGVNVGSCTLTVTVTVAQDKPPVFSEMVYSFNIEESASIGTLIGSVSAVDYDHVPGGVISFNMTTFTDDLFRFDASTQKLYLNGIVDYESLDLYVLNIKACENGTDCSNCTVFINIIDVNDNQPTFSPATYSIRVPENASVSTLVANIFAFDADSGIRGEVIYTIVSSDPLHDFDIFPDNGTLFTVGALDRETYPRYELIVMAHDSEEPCTRQLTSTSTVVITLDDVNDCDPVLKSFPIIYVYESARVESVVGVIVGEDADFGENSRISYTLLSHWDVFAVNATSGQIQLKRALDREAIANYTLQISLSDHGIPSRSTRYDVSLVVQDVNDNPPVFATSQVTSVSVREDQRVGETIFSVFAIDDDEGVNAQLRYYILSGDPSEDFLLDEYSGMVSVSRGLNYEIVKSYQLTIQAEDAALPSLFSTIDIMITVLDCNDAPPIFLGLPFTYKLQEEMTSLPVSVAVITARDVDSERYNISQYSLLFGDDDASDLTRSVFRIDEASGGLVAQKTVNREQRSSFDFQVVAENVWSGSTSLTSMAPVTVIVTDINDNAPIFDLPAYSARIVEGQSPGVMVLPVTASDLDTGRNAELRYALINNTDADGWTVNSVTGWISTTAILDRERADQLNLIVLAIDNGMIPRTASAQVKITVDDINDNTPTFVRDQYVIRLKDPTPAQSFVVGVTALDPDKGLNGTVTYSLQGADSSKFSIGSYTGVVMAKQMLTGISFMQINVTATDGGGRSRQSPVNITFVSGAGFPVFVAPSPSSFQIPESKSLGADIARVTAMGPVAYSVSGGNIDGAFAIRTDGRVVLVKSLDYSRVKKYELWLEARDTVSNKATSININVTVIDENNHAPEFEQAVYNASTLEEQSIFGPVTLITVKAIDLDSGSFGVVTYALVSGNIDNPFVLDNMGNLKLTKKLDRESIPRYTLVISAKDGGGLNSTAFIIINVLDINDNFPRFTSTYGLSISEDAQIGAVVSTLRASDADIGANAIIVYAMVGNNPSFYVDPKSGNITVKGKLDRETQDVYSLVFSASNPDNVSSALSGTTSVLITVTDVNDNAPEFKPSSSYEFVFLELQKPDSVIGAVLTIDRDAPGPNSQVHYRQINPSSFFRINSTTGEIQSKQILDFDPTGDHNNYSMYIVAEDRGQASLSSTATVTITVMDVNDHPPVFHQPQYFSPVAGQVAVGTDILVVTATDTDDYGRNAVVSYSMAGGNGSAYFGVNTQNGTIVSKLPLNDKTGQYLEVIIRATDGGILPLNSTVSVVLLITPENRYSPEWTNAGPSNKFTYNVSEAQLAGSEIAVIRATDADSGINAVVTFSISSGNELGLFSINSTSGQLMITKPLDYEKTHVHSMTIQAEDRAFRPKQKYGVLVINVIDVDDNPPVFAQAVLRAQVEENFGIGTEVTAVKATDLDSGNNSIVRYTVVGDSQARDLFYVDSISGLITTRAVFDYELRTVYTLLVKAFNPYSSRFDANVTVQIAILDSNEYCPQFVDRSYTFSISESALPQSYVGQLKAIDQDGGLYGISQYLLVTNSAHRGFAVNKTSGVLVVAEPLNRAIRIVQLYALVKNPGPVSGMNDTDVVPVTVTLDDANEPPQFSQPQYNASVKENLMATYLTTVLATDHDKQPANRDFVYQLDDPSGKFSIDANTGRILTTGPLDREAIPSYSLVVKAVDRGNPPLTGQAVLYVSVTDVNDNPPYFVPQVPEGHIEENSPIGTLVMQLDQFTFDPDVTPNQGPFSYFMDDSAFSIDSTTGLVYTRVALDYETKSVYMINIRVSDSGIPTAMANLQARIIVTDVNDYPSRSRQVVVQVQSFGHLVSQIIASVEPLDVDTVGNYSCRLPLQGAFSLVGSSCLLQASSLSQPEYNLRVWGNDGLHNDVQSTVKVQYFEYRNATLDSAVVIRVSGKTAEQFVKDAYPKLRSVLANLGGQARQLELLSLRVTGIYLDLFVALRNTDGTYLSPLTTASLVQGYQQQIENQSGLKVEVAARSVCTANVCSGHGVCRSQVTVTDQMDMASSDELVLTYNLASLQARCLCSQDFVGPDCSISAGACVSSPCVNDGACNPQGADKFWCQCPKQWTGLRCEIDVNECDQKVCQHNASCQNLPGGFVCNCTAGFTGLQCDEPIRCLDRNPCLNNATCIDVDSGGYVCDCLYGYYGNLCQHSSMGFQDTSFLEFEPLEESQNIIEITFATSSSAGLLLFQAGDDRRFLALQIINSTVVFSFNTVAGSKEFVSMALTQNVSTTGWFKARAVRSNSRASLQLTSCQNPANCSNVCTQAVGCSVSIAVPSSQLRTSLRYVTVGGLANLDPVIEGYPGALYSGSFVGCISSLTLDKRSVGLQDSLSNAGVLDTCPALLGDAAQRECDSQCGANAPCLLQWFSVQCQCVGFYASTSCDKVIFGKDIALGPGTVILYDWKESYRRSELLRQSLRYRRQTPATMHSYSLAFRTSYDGILLESTSPSSMSSLKISDGFVSYGSLVSKMRKVTDLEWYNISIIVTSTSVSLTVNLDSVNQTETSGVSLLDLTSSAKLSIGSKSYRGCLRDFFVDGERLPLSEAQTDKFDIKLSGNAYSEGCATCPQTVNICGDGMTCSADGARAACVVGAAKELEPWMMIVIIVVSVVLAFSLVLGSVCGIIILRKRRRAHKESPEERKSKLPYVVKSELSDTRRSKGHENLTDEDILASERIMSRARSATPSMLSPIQASRTVPSPYQQLEDSTVIIEGSVTGTGTGTSEQKTDQFYDFDEAASIAPSDVDIRKYYKGYRKGDLEMQVVPAHMRNTHNLATHRETPVQKKSFAAFPVPVRQSPLVVANGRDSPYKQQETPISKLQSNGRRQTPIDELNRRIALEQRQQREDSESSLTDVSIIKQPNWSQPRSQPQSRIDGRPNSQPSRPTSQLQISAQRQQDLNRLSQRSGSSSMDDSDDEVNKRQPMDRNIYSEGGDSSSDESSNDSFTASEFEADEPKVRNDFQPSNMMFTKLQEVEDESDAGDPAAFRTTFSWDGLRNVDNSLHRFIHSSESTDVDSITKTKKQGQFNWDYFLNWGPNFERLVGVFNDISELPAEETTPKHSEDYV